MFKEELLVILFFVAAVVLGSCARVGSPAGGPRDSIPPILIYSEPLNYTTNFEGDEIQLLFDEYVQLNSINSELLVSPPVPEQPNVKLRSRTLLINMNNELRDSTTYTINFGNAIVDFNEQNPLSGLEFVFSTGSHIDSFSVAGRLVNSFTLEPYEEEIHVMLYDNLADSAPYQMLPAFIAKTDEDGEFSINNVKSDTFRIFALKDANSNLLYDLPNEEIAFYDSTVFLSSQLFQFSDTIVVDSSLISLMPEDTAMAVTDTVQKIDSADIRHNYTFYTPMFMFQEYNEQQYLKEDSREDKHKLRMVFNVPVDTVHFKPLNITREDWYWAELFEDEDTIDLWLADTNLASIDSIFLEVSHYGLDTAQQVVWQTDTLLFRYTEKKESSRRGRNEEAAEDEAKKPDLLNLNYRSGATIDLNSTLRLTSIYPVTSIDTQGIKLSRIQDSVMIEEPFQFRGDSLPGMNFSISANWEGTTNYVLFIEPNTFENLYNYSQDTVKANFRTQNEEHYGTVILDVKNVPHNLIIQFISGDKVVRQKMVDQDGKVEFNYMNPQEYQLKVIYDRNSNGEWDTGDYLQNEQPERVDYYEEKISVRSNWDIEYEWDMEK